MFYGFRAVGDTCGELHQLTVEVRAGGIDVVRHECTLDVGGHCPEPCLCVILRSP